MHHNSDWMRRLLHWAIPLFNYTPLQMTINGVQGGLGNMSGGGGGGGGGLEGIIEAFPGGVEQHRRLCCDTEACSAILEKCRFITHFV